MLTQITQFFIKLLAWKIPNNQTDNIKNKNFQLKSDQYHKLVNPIVNVDFFQTSSLLLFSSVVFSLLFLLTIAINANFYSQIAI